MGQTTVNVRVDEDLKRGVEEFCSAVGMNISTAITLFLKAVINQRRIPFDIVMPEDPFYSESNLNYLYKAAADMDAGVNISEHELIEVE